MGREYGLPFLLGVLIQDRYQLFSGDGISRPEISVGVSGHQSVAGAPLHGIVIPLTLLHISEGRTVPNCWFSLLGVQDRCHLCSRHGTVRGEHVLRCSRHILMSQCVIHILVIPGIAGNIPVTGTGAPLFPAVTEIDLCLRDGFRHIDQAVAVGNIITAGSQILRGRNENLLKIIQCHPGIHLLQQHCQAGDVEIAEYGHEKDKQNKPVFNYAVAYDRTNRLPLFYEAYPGSVNDVSQLQHMLDKAAAYGYRNAGFILDRGYFSESNIRFMDRNGFEFIMMVKGCRDLVSSLILEHKGEFEDEWENAVPYYDVNGMTVKGRLLKGDEKDRYFHIYYSDYRKARERAKLQLLIREQKEQLESLKGTAYEKTGGWRSPYFDLIYHTEKGSGKKTLQFIRERQDVISREIRLCGYFCIITSAEMTAETALDLYKSRDSSEKLLRRQVLSRREIHARIP